MAGTSLLNDLDTLIARLEAPLSDEERQVGWTADTKANYATWFNERRSLFARGELDADFGLVRSLDMFGISEGSLCEEALRVNRGLSNAASADPT